MNPHIRMHGSHNRQNGYPARKMNKVTRIIQICRKAVYFGAFHLIRSRKATALLHPNKAKIPLNLLSLRSKILKSADFCSTKAQNTANAVALASILTKGERKSAFLKQGLDYSCHLKEAMA